MVKMSFTHKEGKYKLENKFCMHISKNNEHLTQ